MIEETVADITTIIICKARINVDMVEAGLNIARKSLVRKQGLTLMSPSVCAICAFVFSSMFLAGHVKTEADGGETREAI